MSDLISREKTLDAIRDADVFVFYDADTEIDDAVEIAIRCTKKSVIDTINELPSAEPKTPQNGSITCVKSEKMHDRTMGDCISRKDAIDAVDSETVSTNPEHFKSSEKFIKFMDDVDIASFGKWQWANGFNTALVATRVQLQQLPSAEPETKPISYMECANAMLKMWIDNVLTDGEYNRIMEKLNSKHMADVRGEE